MSSSITDKFACLLKDVEKGGSFSILLDEEVWNLTECPECGSQRIWGKSVRLHPHEGEVVMVKARQCALCGRMFIPFRLVMGTIAVLATTVDYPGFLKETAAYKNKQIFFGKIASPDTIKARKEKEEQKNRQNEVWKTMPARKPEMGKKHKEATTQKDKQIFSGSVTLDQKKNARQKGEIENDYKKEIWGTMPARKPEAEKNHITVGQNVFLVKEHTFSCDKAGHEIERIDARIDVLDRSTAQARQLSIPAGYCKQCRKHFIYMSEYERLLEVGVPVCNVVNIDLHSNKNITNPKYQLQEESVLMQHGYNVKAQDNLSSEARQRILGLLIDYDICSRSRILSYLNYFIKRSRKMDRMENAISKWQEDITFVNSYKVGSTKEVWVDELRNYRHV